MNTDSAIWTFYSFKGGVGRTFVLADVATRLAQWGYNVLAIDWDLEAPGLDSYWSPFISQDHPGLIDFLVDDGESLDRYVEHVGIETDGSLGLIRAGHTSGYTEKLHSIDWIREYESGSLSERLDAMRAWGHRRFDFVLIDSRTGSSDTAGITTAIMPDYVCAVVGPNDQNLKGVAKTMRRVLQLRAETTLDRNALPILPILSRFDSREEHELAQEWKQRAVDQTAFLTEYWLPASIGAAEFFEHVSVPTVPFWSYGESTPALAEKGQSSPNSISYSLEGIAALVSRGLSGASELVHDRDRFVSQAIAVARSRDARKRTDATERLVRSLSTQTRDAQRSTQHRLSAASEAFGRTEVNAREPQFLRSSLSPSFIRPRDLDELHRVVAVGRAAALLGPRGSGKSTTLAALASEINERGGLPIEVGVHDFFDAEEPDHVLLRRVQTSVLTWAQETLGGDEGRWAWLAWKVNNVAEFAALRAVLGDSWTKDGGLRLPLEKEAASRLESAESRYADTSPAAQAIDLLGFAESLLPPTRVGRTLAILVDDLDAVRPAIRERVLRWITSLTLSTRSPVSLVIAMREDEGRKLLATLDHRNVHQFWIRPTPGFVRVLIEHRAEVIAELLGDSEGAATSRAYFDTASAVAELDLGSIPAAVRLADWMASPSRARSEGSGTPSPNATRTARTTALTSLVLGGEDFSGKPQVPDLLQDIASGQMTVLSVLAPALRGEPGFSSSLESISLDGRSLSVLTERRPLWPYADAMWQIDRERDTVQVSNVGYFFARRVFPTCEYLSLMSLFSGNGPDTDADLWEQVGDVDKIEAAVGYLETAINGWRTISVRTDAEWPSRLVRPALDEYVELAVESISSFVRSSRSADDRRLARCQQRLHLLYP